MYKALIHNDDMDKVKWSQNFIHYKDAHCWLDMTEEMPVGEIIDLNEGQTVFMARWRETNSLKGRESKVFDVVYRKGGAA